MRSESRCLLVLASLGSGCTDPHAPAGLDADARVDAPTTLDTALDAAATFSCATTTTIHFDVHPVGAGPIPDGRIVVDFYQLIDNLAVPERIGYDAPFVGTSTAIDIPLASIVLPTPLDDYQYCPRTCFDLSNPACDCPPAEAKLALAFVFIVRDVDGSGAIEPAELTRANRYGVGVLQLGAADRAYGLPNALDGLAPDGIDGCLAPYSIIPPAAGSIFDKLGRPAPVTLPLDVCVPEDASCDLLRVPNLT